VVYWEMSRIALDTYWLEVRGLHPTEPASVEQGDGWSARHVARAYRGGRQRRERSVNGWSGTGLDNGS
jgi:hypothetical protein